MRRDDDFAPRRAHLADLSDEALHRRFWELAERIVAPVLEEARTHTSASIERSVLLRMGFSSLEAKAIVDRLAARKQLGHGAGRMVLELSRRQGIAVREAGLAVAAGELTPEPGRSP
jgi:D-ornithine 4,5-aminomutase subunit alpha